MNQRTLIALGIAIVLGLVAVYLANAYLTATDQRVEQLEAGMTRVAVAAVPLEYGAQVTPDKVRFVDFPQSSIPPGAFREWNQISPNGQPRFVVRPMIQNEPILAAKLAGEGQGASIAYLLPDGMRAAAVRINDVSGVAGFIQPSDVVDVLITRQSTGGDRPLTDVLIQNVRVIAIDQNAQSAEGQPVVAKTATLAVTPTDAQKLALAQNVGQLSLVLRKPGGEEQAAPARTVSVEDLRSSMTGSVAARPASYSTTARTVRRPARRTQTVSRPASPPQPTTRSVQVVRGTEGSNYEVGGYGS